jgi:hypothetical protein
MGESSTPVLEPVKAVEKPKTWRDVSIVDHLSVTGSNRGEIRALEDQLKSLGTNGYRPGKGFAYNIYATIAQGGKVKVTPAEVERFYDGLIG